MNSSDLLQDLEKAPELYRLALTHSSCSKDNDDSLDNERLEFYGDAVLKLIFSEYLYYEYPDLDEGKLTEYRAKLISDALLAKIGFELGFHEKIKLGSSMIPRKDQLPGSVVGDALEAYIGAIYVDKSYDEAKKFVLESWEKHIAAAIAASQEENYKAILQDKLQKQYGEAPVYETLEESGPAHDRNFKMAVVFQGKKLGEGSGNSKKQASQDAAKAALSELS